jgi:alpha-glucosidase
MNKLLYLSLLGIFAVSISTASPKQIKKFICGDFILYWSYSVGQSQTPQLKIIHRSDPDHILWQSIAGSSFVGAAKGTATVSEHEGSFQIQDKIEERWNHQTVDEIKQKNGDLFIQGKLEGQSLTEKKSPLNYEVRFHALSSHQLRFEILLPQGYQDGFRIFLRYASDPEEKVFGFGTQYSYLDLKGKAVPIIVQEQGIGRGLQPLSSFINFFSRGSAGSWNSTYVAVPHYLTNQNRSLFLENYEYSIFDLRKPDRITIEVFHSQIQGRILFGKNPLSLIESYTEFSGRMKPLPQWTQQGAVIGIQGGPARILKVLEKLETARTPVAAFWIQDWVGSFQNLFGKFLWWNWKLDQELYPNWRELISFLKSKGIRVLTYINPFLMEKPKKLTPENRPNDSPNESPTNDLFNQAIQLGYLTHKPDQTPYLRDFRFSKVGMLDLSNKKAKKWLGNIIQTEITSTGVVGWMADFGETLPMDAEVSKLEGTAFRYHNKYPEDWAQLQKEALSDAGLSKEGLVFMRSGYSRSPGLAQLFWLGDQLTSWDAYDGIKTTLIGLVSSGLSGFSLNHSDIGGYTTIAQFPFQHFRTKELFMRWTEMNAFTAFFRTHEGSHPQANHQFDTDDETLSHFSRFANIYKAFSSYRQLLMQEAELKGYPLVRALFLHYPKDPTAYTITHEFMLGSEFLVAPVLDPGVTTVQVYLPQGSWTGFFSNTIYQAGQNGLWTTVDAPMGSPAVFYRSDSIPAKKILEILKKQ